MVKLLFFILLMHICLIYYVVEVYETTFCILTKSVCMCGISHRLGNLLEAYILLCDRWYFEDDVIIAPLSSSHSLNTRSQRALSSIRYS